MAKQIIIIVFMLSVCAWQVHAAVNCTAAGPGRTADPADPTCKNYTLCIYVSTNNSYLSYDYVCPSTSLFSPTLAVCTANYTCPSNTTNTTTTTSLCTADGFIPDPNAVNCSTYIQCVNINGTFIEVTQTCAATTFYNPNTTFCEATYNCTTPFTCTSVGRFPNTADTTCQTYFYCVLLSTGAFTQYNYTCPSTSLFNPASALCTSTYTCTN